MLEVIDLFKSYSTKKGPKVTAVDHVSLSFPETGLVFILGRSGAGKSTFLNLLGGLDKADSGEIRIDGKSSKEFKDADYDAYRNTYLGFVFQEYNLLSEYSVKGNLELALSLQGEKGDPSLFSQALAAVNLSGYEDRRVNELSGGQRQRVAIARALIKNPKVILADEPTGALDSESSLEVLNLLKRLSEDKLVIVVSHDQGFAKQFADRIITFKDGKVVEDENLNPKQKSLQNPTQLVWRKSHLRLGNSLKIAWSSCFRKPVKLAVSVLLTSIAFTLLGVATSAERFDIQTSGVEALQYTKSNYLTMQKQYLESTDEKGNYRTVQMPLGQDDLDALAQKTGLHFEGRLANKNFALQANYADVKVKAYYYYPVATQALYPSDAIPAEFSLVSGRLPQEENELCITLRELEAFQHFGYKAYDSKSYKNVTTSGAEIDQDSILGKGLSGTEGSPALYAIVGVVDTHFDSTPFVSLKTFDDEDDESQKVNESLAGVLASRDSNSFDNLLFVTRKVLSSYQRDNHFYLNHFNATALVENPLTHNQAFYSCGHELTAGQPFVFAQGKTSLKGNEVLVSPNDFMKFLPSESLSLSASLLSRYSALIAEGNRLYATSEQPTPFGKAPSDTQDLFARFRIIETLAFAQEHLSEAENSSFPFYAFGSPAEGATADDHLRAFHTFVWADCFAEEPSSNQDLITPWRNAFLSFFSEKINQALEDHQSVIYAGLPISLSLGDGTFNQSLGTGSVVGFYFPVGDYQSEDITKGCLVLSDELATSYLPYRFDYFKSALAYFPLEQGIERSIVAEFLDQQGHPTMGVRYGILSDALTTVTTMKSTTQAYEVLFLSAGGILLFFAILLFANLIASSINAEQKEIGILRALGARSLDIFAIYGFESLIIALICVLFSTLGTVLAANVFNTFYMSVTSPVAYLHADAVVILLLFLSAVLTAAISSFIPAYRAARKPPVEAIRSL